MANKNTRKKQKEFVSTASKVKTVGQQARTQANNQPKRKRGSLKEYFKGVRLEMKKVIWPTRKDLGSYTAVVLASCIFFALLFWAVDSGVLAALRGLLGINV